MRPTLLPRGQLAVRWLLALLLAVVAGFATGQPSPAAPHQADPVTLKCLAPGGRPDTRDRPGGRQQGCVSSTTTEGASREPCCASSVVPEVFARRGRRRLRRATVRSPVDRPPSPRVLARRTSAAPARRPRARLAKRKPMTRAVVCPGACDPPWWMPTRLSGHRGPSPLRFPARAPEPSMRRSSPVQLPGCDSDSPMAASSSFLRCGPRMAAGTAMWRSRWSSGRAGAGHSCLNRAGRPMRTAWRNHELDPQRATTGFGVDAGR